MAHRTFTDASGTSWEVWDVRPTTTPEIMLLRQELAEGWLAFECERERRRLVPIPVGWERWPVDRLCAACGTAVAQPARRRLIE